MLGNLLLKIQLQLINDWLMLICKPECLWLLQNLIGAALGQLLQGRLDGMSNSLVSGLEVALAFIRRLDTGIRKALGSTSSNASTSSLDSGKFNSS